MVQHDVTDTSSNRQEKISNAARVVGRSRHRRLVFMAICKGKKHVKQIDDIKRLTKLSYKQIRNVAVSLQHEKLVHPVKMVGVLAYERDKFYSKNCRQILRFSESPSKRDSFPTRHTPKISGSPVSSQVRIVVPRAQVRVKFLSIDDIDSFRKVKTIRPGGPFLPMAEKKFKEGVRRIIKEPGTFLDWGGEKNDMFSTRVRVNGARFVAAFGFKGKGMKGVLTPKKMGKNGDQVQRLFGGSADIHIVQYWGAIDQSIYDLLEALSQAKSATQARPIYYCVIDGNDSLRLIKAYPRAFR